MLANKIGLFLFIIKYYKISWENNREIFVFFWRKIIYMIQCSHILLNKNKIWLN